MLEVYNNSINSINKDKKKNDTSNNFRSFNNVLLKSRIFMCNRAVLK